MATLVAVGLHASIAFGGLIGLFLSDAPRVYATQVTSDLTVNSVCAPAVIEPIIDEVIQPQVQEIAFAHTDVPVQITEEYIMGLDLASPSGIPQEFWENWLSDAYKPLASEIVEFDQKGINSAFIVAIMYTECGRSAKTVGKYNYFNFTTDARNYTSFDSPEACMHFAQDWMLSSYFSPEWHATRQEGYCHWDSSEPLTVERINEHYAINSDGTVNWHWSEVVSSIMHDIYCSYLEEVKC